MIARLDYVDLWIASLYGDNGECARILTESEVVRLAGAIKGGELTKVHLDSVNADMLLIVDFSDKYGIWVAGEQTLINNNLPAGPGNVCMCDGGMFEQYCIMDATAIYVLSIDVSYELQNGLR